MIEIVNRYGKVIFTQKYFSNLIANELKNCYGIAEMAEVDVSDSIKSMIYKENIKKGIKVTALKNKLIIDLHVIIIYGVNISAIVNNVIEKVNYAIKENTQLNIKRINVYVDNMIN